MTTGLVLMLLLLAVIVAWVITKVVYYARLSERQWKKVDKSRLKKWKDDD